MARGPYFFPFEQNGKGLSHRENENPKKIGMLNHFEQSPLSAYIHMNNPILRSVMRNQSLPAVLWKLVHKKCKANNAAPNSHKYSNIARKFGL